MNKKMVLPVGSLGWDRNMVKPMGRANQRIAQAADEVLLLMAGLPWRLK